MPNFDPMPLFSNRREILALQAENYALEKQLYSYQQSISKKGTKNRYLRGEDGDEEG